MLRRPRRTARSLPSRTSVSMNRVVEPIHWLNSDLDSGFGGQSPTTARASSVSVKAEYRGEAPG